MDAAYGRIGHVSEGVRTLLAELPAFFAASRNASYERLRLSRWSLERLGFHGLHEVRVLFSLGCGAHAIISCSALPALKSLSNPTVGYVRQ